MTTARRVLQEALREPMQARGWRPRAAGWFTRELAPGQRGVLALSIASRHSAPGSGAATLHVKLRDDAVESAVVAFCDIKADSYRNTTSTTSIGYLMPDTRWREWPVTLDSADLVAHDLAEAAHQYAVPYLQRLLTDKRLLVAAVQSSASYFTAMGLCRAVVLLQLLGNTDAARSLLQERDERLAARTDPAAAAERTLAADLNNWLRSTVR